MTLRFVATPLDAPLLDPTPRPGVLAAGLENEFVPSPARDALVARLREPGALAVTVQSSPTSNPSRSRIARCRSGAMSTPPSLPASAGS